MSRGLTFDTTLLVTIAGTEHEFQCRVTGTYHPFSKGDSPMSWSGPTPDEPESFDVANVFVVRPNGDVMLVPHWLLTEEHYFALEAEAIQANSDQRDAALIRAGEEHEDMRRIFGDDPGDADGD